MLISYEPSSLFPGGFERRETIVANQGAQCQGSYMVYVLNLVFEIGHRYAKTGCVYPTFREQEEPYVLPAIREAVEKAAEPPTQTELQVNLNPDFPDLEKAQFDVLSAFVLAGSRPLAIPELFRYLQYVQGNYTDLGINWLLNGMRSLGYVAPILNDKTWRITDKGRFLLGKYGCFSPKTGAASTVLTEAETNVLKAFAEMKLSATTIDAIFNMMVIAGADTSLLLVERLLDQLEEKQFVVRDGTAVWKLASKGVEFVEGLQKPNKPETQQAPPEVPAKDEGLNRIIEAISRLEPPWVTIMVETLRKLAAPETPQQEEEPLCASHHISVLVPFSRLSKLRLTTAEISECLITEGIRLSRNDIETLLQNNVANGQLVTKIGTETWELRPKGEMTLHMEGVVHESRVLNLLAAHPYGLSESVLHKEAFFTQPSPTRTIHDCLSEYADLKAALHRMVERKRVVRLDKGVGYEPLYWLATNPPGK